jgi:hypothetical protein
MFPKMRFCDNDDVNKAQMHVFLFCCNYTSQIHKQRTHEWLHEVVVFLHIIWHLWAVFCSKDLRDVVTALDEGWSDYNYTFCLFEYVYVWDFTTRIKLIIVLYFLNFLIRVCIPFYAELYTRFLLTRLSDSIIVNL